MHESILSIMKLSFWLYISLYGISLAWSYIMHCIEVGEAKGEKPRWGISSKRRKGFCVSILLGFNYYIISKMPESTIQELGKNQFLSPYVYILAILAAVEIILTIYININLELSELSIGGMKLTKKEDLILEKAIKKGDLHKERLQSKLLSSNIVLRKLSIGSDGIANALKNANNIETEYVQQLKDIMKFYVDEQVNKEENLKINMYFMKNDKYDIIVNEYNISSLKINDIKNDIKENGYSLLDYKNVTHILFEFESIFAGKYIIGITSSEKDALITEEVAIIDSIISTYDQFVFKLLTFGITNK